MANTAATIPHNSRVIRVGMVFAGPVQLLDTALIDLLGMMTPDYLRSVGAPETAVAQGVEFEFHYIAEGGPGSHAETTSSAKYVVTVSHLFNMFEHVLLLPAALSPSRKNGN